MNRSDIKLVIDQLNNLEVVHDYDENVTDSAVCMLKALGNQVAAQAAVIEKLRDALSSCKEEYIRFPVDEQKYTLTHDHDLVKSALAIPTDSKQILQEWLDAKLGEPFTYVYRYYSPYGGDETELSFTRSTTDAIESIPLFKKPEILK